MKIVAIVLCFISLHSFAAKDEVANGGVVFTDKGTFEATLVRFGPEADHTFLAKVSGVDSPLNNKVMKVTSNGGGTGATYYTKEDGGNLFRAPAHEYFGWEAYVGGKTYKINQDTKLSKALNTNALLTEYQKQQKK
jgi:hypothetical protein